MNPLERMREKLLAKYDNPIVREGLQRKISYFIYAELIKNTTIIFLNQILPISEQTRVNKVWKDLE